MATDFKFNVGDNVQVPSGESSGIVCERILHEFIGGRRVVYHYWGRAIVGDEILPPTMYQAHEHEIIATPPPTP